MYLDGLPEIRVIAVDKCMLTLGMAEMRAVTTALNPCGDAIA